MSEFVHEEEVNIRLADALNGSGLDCRPERVSGGRRPDIRCFHNGLIIGIEASYVGRDAEEDARNRIDQGLVDLAIALQYPQRYPGMRTEDLIELVRRSTFNVKIIAPGYVKADSLIGFISDKLGGRQVASTGWFSVDVPTLAGIIRHAVDYLVQEQDVQDELKSIENKINDFVESLNNQSIVERIHREMYKLYGLQSPTVNEIILAQAALSLLLTATFYEHVRNHHASL